MDVTAKLLHDVEFREAKRGGYNTQDVDEFLEQLAVGIERQDAQLRELRQQVAGADARVAEAERRAVDVADGAVGTSNGDDTPMRTLVLAQRTADAAIKEAEDEASRTLSVAQDQAARMVADAHEAIARARAEAESGARRAQGRARTRVLDELRDLEAARDQLHGDVTTLERHLEEQRDRLRLTMRELQRLLDDPTALREVHVPEVSDVVVPEAPAAAPVDDPQAQGDDEAWQEPEARAGESPATADAHPRAHEVVDLLEEPEADDDAYLAELRKAMTDESPLGPREEGDVDPLFDAGSEPGRTRFGRRS